MSGDHRFSGFQDLNGDLGRPVPAGQVLVPEEVRLKDGYIHWRMGSPERREVSRSMLNQFIRLTDPDSVFRFAKEWGVLALSGNLWSGSDPGGQFYLPGRRLKRGVEPVLAWQYYSKRAQAILNIAAALKQGRLGDLIDWGEFATFFSDPRQKPETMRWVEANLERHSFGLGLSVISGYGTHEERLERAQEAIASEIGEWLDCWKKERIGGVSDFALRWIDNQRRWDLQIDYHGLLFPAIALQLALVLADADSLYTCSGCGIPYIRPRERKRPKAGWANYCDRCSKDGVAQRRAVETYREKRAEARRLHSGGTPVSAIAKQLNTEAARISAWLEKEGKDAKTKARK